MLSLCDLRHRLFDLSYRSDGQFHALVTLCWFPYNHLWAQTTAGTPPPGIASYEGADVVTASEARKLARRLMCAANEIDRLSEHDCAAARRADAWTTTPAQLPSLRGAHKRR
jgi:hypothetical protein